MRIVPFLILILGQGLRSPKAKETLFSVKSCHLCQFYFGNFDPIAFNMPKTVARILFDFPLLHHIDVQFTKFISCWRLLKSKISISSGISDIVTMCYIAHTHYIQIEREEKKEKNLSCDTFMFRLIEIIFPKTYFFFVPVKVMLIKICHEFCTYTYLMDFVFSSSSLSLVSLFRWIIRETSVWFLNEANCRSITYVESSLWITYTRRETERENAPPTFFSLKHQSHGLNTNIRLWPCSYSWPLFLCM